MSMYQAKLRCKVRLEQIVLMNVSEDFVEYLRLAVSSDRRTGSTCSKALRYSNAITSSSRTSARIIMTSRWTSTASASPWEE